MTSESDDAMRSTKTDMVYRRLRQMIIDLQLEPGEPLQKDKLTELFGVSRAPVNEALARLRNDDLVYIAPQHGSFVQLITVTRLNEGIFFRRAVEPAAVARLAAKANSSLIDSLEENLGRQTSAIEAGDLSALHVLDDAFHSLILSEIDLEFTIGLIRTFSAHLERARNLAADSRRNMTDTLREHKQIFEAIRMKDPDWARSAMDLHLSSALAGLTRRINETPELFRHQFSGEGGLQYRA